MECFQSFTLIDIIGHRSAGLLSTWRTEREIGESEKDRLHGPGHGRIDFILYLWEMILGKLTCRQHQKRFIAKLATIISRALKR